MAIRKDLDDMLNNLRGNSPENAMPSNAEMPKAKSIYDTMSVDDLLNALTVEKKPTLAENILNELDEKESKAAEEAVKAVPEPKPVTENDAPKQKKKVVITGELPDYEELRRQEEEQKKQERLRAESRSMNRTAVIPVPEPEPETEAVPEPEIILEPEAVPEPEVIPEPAEIAVPEENTQPVQESESETVAVQEEISEEIVPEIPEKEQENPESHPETVVLEEIEKDKDQEKRSSKKKKKVKPSKHSKKNSAEDDEKKKSAEKESTDEVPETEISDLFNGESSENDALQPFESESGESATDLIEAALAAINGTATMSESTEETSVMEDSAEEHPEKTEENPEQKDGVSTLIEGIREDAANAIAEIEEHKETEEASEESTEKEKAYEEEKSGEEKPDEQKESAGKGKITSALTKILDEDPETLIDVKKEKTEDDEEQPPKKKKLKRNIFAVLGVIFTIFAVIGIVTTVGWGIRKIRGFATGEAKKDGFTELIYPVVIMDIESFDKPADLTSEQIITASIWSIIMDDEKLEKYPVNVAGGDVISISAYDIEAEAVALFGQDHAEFVHTTVGPMNSRFYYDAEKGVYNVPIHPIVFTYEPEIKSIVKSGSDYTITVDYIDERPSWMEKSVSKSVEFHVTEKSDGTYQFNSMKILFVKNNL
ncbi:MAG: hypothetical protein IJA18_04110 [Ruminococcus sp.]|nr:hypothetical protein [Ruminococcus sp.]